MKWTNDDQTGWKDVPSWTDGSDGKDEDREDKTWYEWGKCLEKQWNGMNGRHDDR